MSNVTFKEFTKGIHGPVAVFETANMRTFRLNKSELIKRIEKLKELHLEHDVESETLAKMDREEGENAKYKKEENANQRA